MINNLIPLENVVKSFISASGEKDMSNYMRYCQIVIEAYTDLFPNLPCYRLAYRAEVLPNNVIDLPADLVDVCRVGIVKNGNIEPLFVNNNLVIPESFSGVATVESPDYITPSKPGFTQGGTSRTKYKIDKLRRQIILQGDYMHKEIYVEYLGTGIKANDITFIERGNRQLIETLLMWRLEFTKKGRSSEAIRLEDSVNHYVRAITKKSLPSAQEVTDIANEFGTLA